MVFAGVSRIFRLLLFLVPSESNLFQLKYTRPGLPTVSQEVLCKWKSEIKMYRRIHCPNQVTMEGHAWLGSTQWLHQLSVVSWLAGILNLLSGPLFPSSSAIAVSFLLPYCKGGRVSGVKCLKSAKQGLLSDLLLLPV